jgi:hypothetical protein
MIQIRLFLGSREKRRRGGERAREGDRWLNAGRNRAHTLHTHACMATSIPIPFLLHHSPLPARGMRALTCQATSLCLLLLGACLPPASAWLAEWFSPQGKVQPAAPRPPPLTFLEHVLDNIWHKYRGMNLFDMEELIGEQPPACSAHHRAHFFLAAQNSPSSPCTPFPHLPFPSLRQPSAPLPEETRSTRGT